MGTAHTCYLDGYLAAEGSSPAVREASGRMRLLAEGPVYVEPGELIVGALYRSLADEALVTRISAHYVQGRALEGLGDRRAEVEGQIERIASTLVDRAFPRRYSDGQKRASESGTALCCHFNGHMVLDYGRLLDRGLGGLRSDVRAAALAAGPAARDFYRAMELTIDGAAAFIRRHADAAAAHRAALRPGDDRARLAAVQDACRHVAEHPPRTFHEGVQLLWFGMMLADYDSFGRFDQYLLACHRDGQRRGETAARVDEVLEDLWRRVEEHGGIINMTIGGTCPDGSDATNALTWKALETTRRLGFKSPNLCLRIGPAAPRRLWEEAHAGLATGQSLPALYNDALVVPLLEAAGIATDDARDYCLAGCSQVVIPGRSSFGCDMGAYNALKCLELALRDGVDPRTGAQAGPRTGAPGTLASFEDLLRAWRAQAGHAVAMGVGMCNADSAYRVDFCSCVRSLLTADCIARGASIFQGGARYYAIQSEIVGLTNTANALAAIRDVVFGDHLLTLDDLVRCLDADFDGREDLRQRLLRAPKFGNDEPGVDAIRARITREFYRELGSRAALPGGVHWPGEVIFSYHVDLAPRVGASADGRRAGAPLADSAGAAQGTDTHGPTALLASMLALPQAECRTCCSLNLRFTPGLWNGAREEVIDLLRSYFARGGFQVQVNVVDAATLRRARSSPDAYRSLVVRVGGFSAYFTQLSPALQDEIIGRTAHGSD
jgi:pyruvate-formate lyase